MSGRFFELAIRARRQLGGDFTQFSFRLAFMIDLAYVGIGALGGAAVGRATTPNPTAERPPLECRALQPVENERR